METKGTLKGPRKGKILELKHSVALFEHEPWRRSRHCSSVIGGPWRAGAGGPFLGRGRKCVFWHVGLILRGGGRPAAAALCQRSCWLD
jgi:hypothetical protein